jgi:hypothetical protein
VIVVIVVILWRLQTQKCGLEIWERHFNNLPAGRWFSESQNLDLVDDDDD